MNKTIADAHKELKGDLGNTKTPMERDEYLFYRDSLGDYICSNIREPEWAGIQYICTVEEFNNYKGESMGVDWSKAPKDCVGYSVSSCLKGYWILHNDFELAAPDFGIKTSKYFDRPQTKSVYTQEMCDAGELPPIDSLFIDTVYNKYEPVLALAHHDGQVIYVSGQGNDKEYFGAEAGECKPLNQLIDGDFYGFEYNRKAYRGIYSKKEGRFIFADGHVMTGYCTNIKPLTVEGE